MIFMWYDFYQKAKGEQTEEMTNEELYQLMKDGFDQVKVNFDQVNQRFTEINQRLDRVDQRLDGMDTRLRTVENGISGLKGRQSAIPEIRNWITISCAISALVISIAVAIFK